jgi:hypothetical protein
MTSASETTDAWRPVFGRVLVVAFALPLLALPTYGLNFAASVALGAALAVANFWLIARGVQRIVSGRVAGAWKGLFVVKFSVAVAGLYLLFERGFVQGLPLLVGLLALPVGIVLHQLFPASRQGTV